MTLDLRAWQDAMALTVEVYKLTSQQPFAREYGLCDQIRRASVSITSTIAEGDERGTNQQAVYYLNVAKGSTAEVITPLNIEYRVGFIDEATLQILKIQSDKILASLKNLIKARGGENPINWLCGF